MAEFMARCRSCQAPIWWRLNPSGKRQPLDFDMVVGQPTQTPHHATCPSAQQWRKARSAAVTEPPEEAPLPWWYV
jgi:hypothetical protein